MNIEDARFEVSAAVGSDAMQCCPKIPTFGGPCWF